MAAVMATTSDETSELTSSFAGGHVTLYGATPTETASARRTRYDIFSTSDGCVASAAAAPPTPGTGQNGSAAHETPENIVTNEIFHQEQVGYVDFTIQQDHYSSWCFVFVRLWTSLTIVKNMLDPLGLVVALLLSLVRITRRDSTQQDC